MENVFRKKVKKHLFEDDGNYKLYKIFIASCFFMYMTMMTVKYVFTAELTSIVLHYQSNKSQITLANTFYYVTYAATQIILTFFFGKINVRKYLLLTIPFAGVIYIAVAFLTNLTVLWWLFALNGIMQAGIWSGCILLLSNYLPQELLSRANVIMNQGANLGTIASISICSIFVGAGMWQMPFIVLGAILIVSVILFGIVTKKVISTVPKKVSAIAVHDTDTKINQALFILDTKAKRCRFYICPFIIIFLLNWVYYGIMGLLSPFLKETFEIEEWVSILLSIFVPLVSIMGPIFSIWYCERRKNYIKNYMIFNLIPFAVLVAMIFIFDKNIVLTLICLSLIIVTTKAMTVITSVAAFNMRMEINSGSFSAFVNAGASIAAGVAPFVISSIIETTHTYQTQYIVLAIICGVMLTIVSLTYLMTKKHARF